MITLKEWRIKKQLEEMAGTGAIYNGEKAQDGKRDYNWWGDPASSVKLQPKNNKDTLNRSGSPKKGK